MRYRLDTGQICTHLTLHDAIRSSPLSTHTRRNLIAVSHGRKPIRGAVAARQPMRSPTEAGTEGHPKFLEQASTEFGRPDLAASEVLPGPIHRFYVVADNLFNMGKK